MGVFELRAYTILQEIVSGRVPIEGIYYFTGDSKWACSN